MNKLKELIRYLIAGSIGFITNISAAFFAINFLEIWYLISSALAFLTALLVSFLLQKLWTFKDKSQDKINHQIMQFFVIALINLGINLSLVYIFVEKLYLPFLASQALSAILIAIESFFIYKFFIFNTSRNTDEY